MSWLRHVARFWCIHTNQISSALQRTRGGRVLVIGTNYGLTEALLALSCGVWLWAQELSDIVDTYYGAAARWGTKYYSYDTFTAFDTPLDGGLLLVPDWIIWMTWDEWLVWATICLCAFSFLRRIRTSERFGKLPASVLFGMFIGGTDGAQYFENMRGDYYDGLRQNANNPQKLAELTWKYRIDCCRLTRATLWDVLKAGPEWVLGRFRPNDQDGA